MPDWVDYYIDNEGYENNNKAFGFTSRKIEACIADNLSRLIKEVIRQCANKEKDLNSQNFKKLKITIVNEYCFNSIRKLESKKYSKYEYIILLPEDSMVAKNTSLIKHKIAHEIAHFLFSLQEMKFNNDAQEELECNKKAEEWGFPEPILPDIEKVKNIINEWANYYPRIIRIYLFGSYVKKNKSVINDIDIAIEISHKEGDTDFSFWCSEGKRLETELNSILNYEVDLECFRGEETPTIKRGLAEGNILIYEKSN